MRLTVILKKIVSLIFCRTKRHRRKTIKREVRQGCIVSPSLFNVYSELLFQSVLARTEDGINTDKQLEICRWHSLWLPTFLKVYNDCLIEYQLRWVLMNINSMDLHIKTKKTKYILVISRDPNQVTNVTVGRTTSKNSEFKYLSSWIVKT